MSLLNVWVSRDRALVAVDTLGARPDGSFDHCSKVHYLPHSGLVVAVRGVIQFGRLVFDALDETCASYDAANEHHKEIFACVTDFIRQQASADPQVRDRLDFAGQEVVFAGWSEQRRSLHATSYKRTEEGGEFVSTPIDPWCAAPGDANWGRPPVDDLSTAEGMERLARWQVMHFRKASPSDAIGGRLLLVELTRGRTTVKTQCDLG